MLSRRFLRGLAIPAGLLPVLALVGSLVASIPAQASTKAENAQIFSGTVLTASGTPASGLKVYLYLMPDAAGQHATPVGSATTASNGKWTLIAPSFSSLPKVAQQAVTANMGYLDVDAIANSGMSAALTVESVWIGTPTLTEQLGSTRPLPMVMRLTASGGSTSDDQSNCCGRFGCQPPLLQKVLRSGHSYTAVGEWHAYWNASGGVSYTRGATSNIGSYVSVNEADFTFKGYDTFSTSHSVTMGFPSNGPDNSHQMVISFKYRMARYVQYNANGSAECSSWRQIDERGLYDPGHGWELWKLGKNIIKDDGKTRYDYERKHRAQDIDRVPATGGFTLTVGSAITYGAAASAFGVGIQAETNHSTAVAQIYKALGSHKRSHYEGYSQSIL